MYVVLLHSSAMLENVTFSFFAENDHGSFHWTYGWQFSPTHAIRIQPVYCTLVFGENYQKLTPQCNFLRLAYDECVVRSCARADV